MNFEELKRAAENNCQRDSDDSIEGEELKLRRALVYAVLALAQAIKDQEK